MIAAAEYVFPVFLNDGCSDDPQTSDLECAVRTEQRGERDGRTAARERCSGGTSTRHSSETSAGFQELQRSLAEGE
jgi:hypothetical protein